MPYIVLITDGKRLGFVPENGEPLARTFEGAKEMLLGEAKDIRFHILRGILRRKKAILVEMHKVSP